MEELIRLENIRVNLHANDWQDAIRKAGYSLVECGSINEQYLENCINSVKELGPYIVLMPYFALAHSAPCDDVLKSDMSIATFENDICFGTDNDPVRVIICLACKDKESHISKISKIGELLMDEDRDLISKLRNCDSADALYSILNEE